MSSRAVRSALLVILALGLVAAPRSGRAETPTLAANRDVHLENWRVIALSPDGKQIAAADIELKWLCLFDSQTLAQGVCADLSVLHAGFRTSDLVWSPDSTRLAFSEQAFQRF